MKMKSIVKGLLVGVVLCVSLLSANAAEKKRVVLISGEYEYASMLTLPALAEYLEDNYDLDCTYLHRSGGDNIPGLEALEKADLAILCIRRMTLPDDQLAYFKRYMNSGKPLIGIRTTSHAFENWKSWDAEVLGGNYHGHHGNSLKATAHVIPEVKAHPLLNGVAATFPTGGSLYETAPLADGAIALLNGKVKGEKPEPMAWTHKYKKSRVFYTSLGHPVDFTNQAFMQLMVNAVFWSLYEPAPLKPVAPITKFPSQVIEVEAFERFAKHPRTLVLDVRSPEEFAGGHVKKALNINYHADDFKEQLAKLDRNVPYALHCRSGGRSGRTAKLMREMGFHFVYDFSGSMNAWEAAGKPVIKGSK